MSSNQSKPNYRITELTKYGVKILETADEVDQALKEPGTSFFIVNSVCESTDTILLPAFKIYMTDQEFADQKPDRMYSVFAGLDRESTNRLRQHIDDQQPGLPHTSPSVAFFKDGKLSYYLIQPMIEEQKPYGVAADIANNILDMLYPPEKK
ncbi:putative YphP/YqiW family bacilliredoxin [Chitinophaga dinghuensis]|uniref:Putative YphP/YqiW family bacilliredoxin n=1 Tax=Chitinophaga dinghuensis TaxID=1539050 RepID=A0A327VY12_9BACT|nr:BrxA/BrxB family bacilliredoxin [Chitinophaga dinghuensis]RAJ80080.1 putative YphP/YqiW family bacilliredoxin [Chitinophaga dinghuensis]